MERYFNSRMDTLDQQIVQNHSEDMERARDTERTIEKAIMALRELIESQHLIHDERFRGAWAKFEAIQTQFHERDVRSEKTESANKVAVDAAFVAAERQVAEQNRASGVAIQKSEAAVNKQIEALGVLINNTRDGFTTIINDIKERVGRMESKGLGAVEQRQTTMSNAHLWVAVAGVLGTLGGVLLTSISSLLHH